MHAAAHETLSLLYEQDETDWLEQMSDLVARRRLEEIDWDHLSEYLSDMAIRDRREVFQRLVRLLVHLIKWEHQPSHRSRSWEMTITTQRLDLGDLLESKTLRNHAGHVLEKAYARARKLVAGETGLVEDAFPTRCPMTLEQVLSDGR